MTEHEQGTIEAAGGLLWRKCSTGCEIAIVHRNRDGRKEWTLPKGKREGGESWRRTALREVREETGYNASMSDYAGAISYQVNGKAKVVRFWHMVPTGDARQEVDDKEVDDLRWLSAKEALKQLDYPLERALLETSLQRPYSLFRRNLLRRAWSGFFVSPSLKRLGNTFDAVESDLAATVEQASRMGDASVVGWHRRSRQLLDSARQAFNDGDAERGWHCLKIADRCMLYGRDPKQLRNDAGPILAEASDEGKGLSKWRRTSIQELLCEDGKLKSKLDQQDVVRAKRILDEHHDNVYQKMEILKGRLRLLTLASLAALAAWLMRPPLLPYPSSLTAAADPALSSPRLMWFGVVLAAVLGALFSGFSSSISADQKTSRIPSELFTSTVTFARLSMAAVAGLAASILLASGALTVLTPSYELMLAVAFVAGFSDRLLLRGVASLSK